MEVAEHIIQEIVYNADLRNGEVVRKALEATSYVMLEYDYAFMSENDFEVRWGRRTMRTPVPLTF